MKIKILLLTITLAGFCSASAQSWTQTSAPSDAGWISIASSANGSVLVAACMYTDEDIRAGVVYVSTNSGVSWTQTSAPSNHWAAVCSSADGSRLVAACRPGPIYTSTNSGASWVSNNAPNIDWYYLACSGDGTKIIATADTRPLTSTTIGAVYTSTNSGNTWISNSLPVSTPYWFADASSADGNKLVVLSQYGPICTSTNGGSSWQQATNAPNLIWRAVASSANGTRLALVSQLQGPTFGGSIYTSSDSGVTWVSNNAPNLVWLSVISTADGSTLEASALASPQGGGSVYVSTNGGQAWGYNSTSGVNSFGTLASSADGNHLAAIFGGGIEWTPNPIYLQTLTFPIALNIASPNTDISLSWTIPSTNFVLQQSSNLINWSSVTNSPVPNLTNLQNQVTLPLSATNSFFRLATP